MPDLCSEKAQRQRRRCDTVVLVARCEGLGLLLWESGPESDLISGDRGPACNEGDAGPQTPISSVVRASACRAEGHRFKSGIGDARQRLNGPTGRGARPKGGELQVRILLQSRRTSSKGKGVETLLTGDPGPPVIADVALDLGSWLLLTTSSRG